MIIGKLKKYIVWIWSCVGNCEGFAKPSNKSFVENCEGLVARRAAKELRDKQNYEGEKSEKRRRKKHSRLQDSLSGIITTFASNRRRGSECLPVITGLPSVK